MRASPFLGKSPLRRLLAGITIVVGWYFVMQASSWSRNMVNFAAGAWSTDTASVSLVDLVAVAAAGALCVIAARLVGYLSGWHAGMLVLMFWTGPMGLSYCMGAVLSGFGPGAGATSEESQSAAMLVILGSPLFAGLLMARLNKLVEGVTRPGAQEINSNERPIAWFFHGPLQHTPQGIACLFFCLCSIVAAIVYAASPSESPFFGFRLVLFAWPAPVFLTFAVLGYKNGFRPSIEHALLVSLVGAIPFLLPFVLARPA